MPVTRYFASTSDEGGLVLACDDDAGYADAFSTVYESAHELSNAEDVARSFNEAQGHALLVCDSRVSRKSSRGIVPHTSTSIEEWLHSTGICEVGNRKIVVLSGLDRPAPDGVHRWYYKSPGRSLESLLQRIKVLFERTIKEQLVWDKWPEKLERPVEVLTSAIHALNNLPIRLDAETISELPSNDKLSEADRSLCEEIWTASFAKSNDAEDQCILESCVSRILRSVALGDSLPEAASRTNGTDKCVIELQEQLSRSIRKASEGLDESSGAERWVDPSASATLCECVKTAAQCVDGLIVALRFFREEANSRNVVAR